MNGCAHGEIETDVARATIRCRLCGETASLTRDPGPREHNGYRIGRDGGAEIGVSEVCPHSMPLGWACVGCRQDRGEAIGTRPAARSNPRKFVYRAVCLHCGQRSWLPGEEIPQEIRRGVDAEEMARKFPRPG